MPFFSIVIAAYNREHLLPATLESVKAQTYTDYEVIVVDDGSADNTAGVAEDFDMPIKIVRQENRGLGAARNAGMKLAEGEYFTFLDSDDIYLPWALETFRMVIDEYDQPSIVGVRTLNFTDESQLTDVPQPPLECEYFDDYFSSSDRGLNPAPSCSAVRVDVMNEAGGFFEHRLWCEDLDMWMRLGDKKGFLSISQPYLVGMRTHGSQMTGDIPKLYKGESYVFGEEKKGNYPGGEQRKAERERLLSRFARGLSMRALKHSERGIAWKIYREFFGMHLKQGRFRYLLGFPMRLVLPAKR